MARQGHSDLALSCRHHREACGQVNPASLLTYWSLLVSCTVGEVNDAFQKKMVKFHEWKN